MISARIQQHSILNQLWHSATFNTWASLATRSINLVVLIPFILRHFSAAEITLWYMFGTIINLNLIIDVGLSVTFTRYIAYAMGGASNVPNEQNSLTFKAPNRDYLRRVVGTQQVLFKWLTLLLTILLLSIGTWTLIKPIHYLSNEADGWIAWGIVIIGTAICFNGNVYVVYLQGINRVAEFRRYETLFSLASILSSVVVLAFGTGLITLIAINQFWIILSVVRNRWLCSKYNEGGFGQNESKVFDKKIVNDIWPNAWRSGLGMLMSYGVLQSSSLIYAQVGQVEQASAYLFAMRIMQIIITFAQAPFYSKLPLMARLQAEDDHQKIIEVAKKGMHRAHWTYVLGIGAVALFAKPIMQIIGSQIPFVDQKLWAIMGIAFFMERYGAMHLQLYSITNHIVWHIANGITGAIYIILAWISYSMLGVFAFPISMLIAYLGFYSWYSSVKSYKAFNLNFKDFELKQVLQPLLLILLIAICAFLFDL